MTEISFDENLARRPFKNRGEMDHNGPAGDKGLLDHYLKRIDPKVAESFTDEQRDALGRMLGLRGMVQHSIELRRSLRFGRRRYYMVFLLGDESRTLHRLQAEGQQSLISELLAYLGSAIFWLSPLVLAVLALAWTFGAI